MNEEYYAKKRREEIAIAAMTGLIAAGDYLGTIPERAVKMADRLIAELDKEKEE